MQKEKLFAAHATWTAMLHFQEGDRQGEKCPYGRKREREIGTRSNGSNLISRFLRSNLDCWMLGEFIGLIVHKFFLYTAPKEHLLRDAAQAEFVLAL